MGGKCTFIEFISGTLVWIVPLLRVGEFKLKSL